MSIGQKLAMSRCYIPFRITRHLIFSFRKKQKKTTSGFVLHSCTSSGEEKQRNIMTKLIWSPDEQCSLSLLHFEFYNFFAIKIRYARSVFFGYWNILQSKWRVNEFRCFIGSLCPAREFRKAVVCTESHVMAVKNLVWYLFWLYSFFFFFFFIDQE